MATNRCGGWTTRALWAWMDRLCVLGLLEDLGLCREYTYTGGTILIFWLAGRGFRGETEL